MLKGDTDLIDLNVLHRMIDLMKLEHQPNNDKEYNIHIVKQDLLKCLITIQSLQEGLQELQAQLKFVETENYQLRMINSYQADTIAELQSQADPYSTDGNPICNSELSQT